MDDYLLLRLGGDAALEALVGRPRLQLELGGELVIEVLGGVVLEQVKLPPERLGAAEGAGVEHLSARATQTQGRL